MRLVYAMLAVVATVAVYILIHKGEDLVASYCFTLAVWAWGKADYHDLKDEIRGR